MSRDYLKFVVVGSVDHGKSTLIGRFLYDTGSLSEAQLQTIREISRGSGEQVEFAFVLDHLAEERARRITIDTTQTFFSSRTRDYVIIDAPGHKEFVKNMITGASQASAAMLLLDVHEGLREQTHRHAYMVSLLGIKQLIVVLNKMDKVGYAQGVFEEMSKRIGALLKKLTLDHLAIVPASALAGDNIVRRSERMRWYEGPTVIGTLDLLQPDVADENLPLRLPVQDVYEVDGKELAVGRLASGTVKAGQKVQICPTGQVGEIGVLRKFEGPTAAVAAGESIGFALADGSRLRRGQTLCPPEDLPAVSDSVTARVFWMAKAPLRRGELLALRLATQEIPCTVERIVSRTDSGSLEVLAGDSAELANTEVAEVTLAAKEPVHYDSFGKIAEMGRLVLMRGADIVAGGILP